jgi:GT2 family glycosyltransferase/tetratricopeptide (TPR) repeat protein
MSDSTITTVRTLIQGNRLREARQMLMNILRDAPSSVEAMNELATVEVLEGKYESGLDLIEEILLVDPEEKNALGKRGLINTYSGRNGGSPNIPELKNRLLDSYRQGTVSSSVSGAPFTPPAICPDPKFSIIIPVYNQLHYTKQCIETIWATCKDHAYEIIVVDDCSTDETHEYLQSVKSSVRSFRNEKNQGFILNCNFAARQAKGEYIVLLNNDTIPQEGWLEGLLEPFGLFDKVGATGALMIHPDNKILEACSIVFSDGSGWNYGRGDSPNSPRYNFIRDVDYVSGGGMMVPKRVWEELGGLDTHYCPAYYDDIDLCFRARRAGYRVLYTPYARIIHFEGMSGGTDVTKGVKRYQVINHGKFQERWKDELKNQYENKYENVFRASRRGEGKRILWIDHVLPLPNFNSGCLRMNYLMKSLVKLGHKITYVALSNSDPDDYARVMRKMGVETVSLGYESWVHSGKEGEIVDKVLDLLEVRKNNYDVVYLSFYWVAQMFIRKIRRRMPTALIYVDSHDIHFLRTQREAELHKDRLHRVRAEQTKIEELGVYARADAVLTVTDLDRQALLKELPAATVLLMPNAHDVVPVEKGFDGRKDLLFVGGFNHTPNVDAMLYFCREIFPKVRRRIPDIKLWIVGSNPTEEVKALAGDAISVTGWVKETKPYLDACKISIAPLRYGAGMKGKVGEAMCHGLPVVTTSVGSEGMGIVNNEHALVVEKVDEWVEQIVRLYNDGDLWRHLSAKGQELMSQRYGSDEMLTRARRIMELNTREEVAALSPVPSARRKASDDVSVSIIIVTYNQVEYTKECIASIKEFTRVPHRIIVVDNCSTDKTRSYLKTLPGVDVLLNDENVGFPAACNQAINRADGDYVLLLNNDAVVTEGWLERLVEIGESEPTIGLVGPMSNSISGLQLDKNARYNAISEMHKYARNIRKRNRGEIATAPRIAFFCTLIRKELLDQIGGLDERFSPGNFEDDDFCLRAQLAGFKTLIARDVFIHHYGSKSFGADGQEAYSRRLEINRKVFVEKWGADPIEIWRDRKGFRKRNVKFPLSKDGFIQYFEQARILIEEKDLILALLDLKKAIENFPTGERTHAGIELADVLNLAGNVAMAAGDRETAELCFRREFRTARDRSRAEEALKRLETTEPGSLAIASASTLSGGGEVAQTLHVVEQLCYRGRVADGISVLEQAVKQMPGDGTLRITLAWLNIKNKMYDEASALIGATSDDIKRSNPEWLDIAGYCLEGQGLDDLAMQCADKAMKVSPAPVRALTLKGILSLKSGDAEEALQYFDRAITLASTDALPHLHKGALLWARGEQESGFECLEKAFVLDPADAEIAVTYYSAANALSRLADAEARFRDASTKLPSHKQLKHFLVDVQVRMGKAGEAMVAAEDAIAAFGADGDIVPLALEIRKAVGPRTIAHANGHSSSVSLCMIVKDEEEYLPKCLASVRPLVDEMILVDTGSTDKTKEIATLFGAQLFSVAWTEDFSEARNFSLSKATGDWILVLDGDEFLSGKDCEKLKTVMAVRGEKRAYSFVTRNYIQQTGVPGWIRNDGLYAEEAGTGWISSEKVRLFPRNDTIQFRGAVHELVESSLAEAGVRIEKTDVPIHHYGKLNSQKSRDKGRQYLRLGEKKLEETGRGDLKALSELAIQENELGNYEAALEISNRLAQLDPQNGRAHLGVASNLIGLGRFADAIAPLKKAIKCTPDLKEGYIKIAIAYISLGRAAEAIPHVQRLLTKHPEYPYSKAMMAVLYLCEGRKSEGLVLIESMKRENLSFETFFGDLALQLKDVGQVEYAIQMLEGLYESGNITQQLALVLVESYKAKTLVT